MTPRRIQSGACSARFFSKNTCPGASVVPTLDPAVVVVGGYWSQFVGDIDTAYRSNRPTIGGGALEPIPSIVAARVGPDAGFLGARRRARDRLIAQPLLLAG